MADVDDPSARAVALHEQAIAQREAGRYRDAERVCREAVAIFEEVDGPNSPDLANALIEHGRLLELLDRHGEAETALDRAIEILESMVADRGPEDADEMTLAVEEELVRLLLGGKLARASVLRARGRLDEAEAAYRRILERAEATFPDGDHLVAEALNGLGMVYKFQGRYADAEPLYRRALVYVEAVGGEEEQATLLHNLGGLCHARGDFVGGEPLARRAVELRQARLGPHHPVVAADREAWGALLEGLGRLPEAERAYADALATFESHQGPMSLEAASSLAALGSVQHAQGRLDDALASYRRALVIREARLPAQHFDLALTMNNLAMLLDDRGAADEARGLLERALAIFTISLGPGHPHTRAVSKNIAALAQRN